MENNYGSGLYQDGTFYFTNPGLAKFKTKEGDITTDFCALWNNKEYTFKGKTTSPLIIAGEPPENVQHIRFQQGSAIQVGQPSSQQYASVGRKQEGQMQVFQLPFD